MPLTPGPAPILLGSLLLLQLCCPCCLPHGPWWSRPVGPVLGSRGEGPSVSPWFPHSSSRAWRRTLGGLRAEGLRGCGAEQVQSFAHRPSCFSAWWWWLPLCGLLPQAPVQAREAGQPCLPVRALLLASAFHSPRAPQLGRCIGETSRLGSPQPVGAEQAPGPRPPTAARPARAQIHLCQLPH